MIQICYLADHLELAPLLAGWHHAEWRELMPEWSHAEALADLQSHTGHRQIPTTLVALEDRQLLGSVSLITRDLPGWEHLEPWLASLYVAPDRRGQGIGKQLVRQATTEAAALGLPALYLFTAGQQEYYERLGWELHARTRHHGTDVVILRRM